LIEVIKFGGSLCHPDTIHAAIAWLEQQAQSHSVVVVCGGGAYADLVRTEQQRLGFDDVIAHRQALLAMEQTAFILQGTWQQRTGRAMPISDSGTSMTLWSPRRLLLDQNVVPASWDITSDSLAVWLAKEIGASLLSLMKSLDISFDQGSPVDWHSKGWVDAAFSEMALGAAYPIRLVGRQVWG
jgi:aspartokinase-like uncharacterized kinase